MIESLFVFESTRRRQRSAPLLKEREQYLSHLLSQGTSRTRTRTIASMLLNIVRLFELVDLRSVSLDEIRTTGLRWINDTNSRRTRSPGSTSYYTFTYIAEKWFRFHNKFEEPDSSSQPFGTTLQEFCDSLRSRGFASQTILACRIRVRQFLRWLALTQSDLLRVSIGDVSDFIGSAQRRGCKPRTLVGISYIFVNL